MTQTSDSHSPQDPRNAALALSITPRTSGEDIFLAANRDAALWSLENWDLIRSALMQQQKLEPILAGDEAAAIRPLWLDINSSGEPFAHCSHPIDGMIPYLSLERLRGLLIADGETPRVEDTALTRLARANERLGIQPGAGAAEYLTALMAAEVEGEIDDDTFFNGLSELRDHLRATA